ncbi:MAG: hypothetical protein CSA22_06370 [Deltaproteobacteria bacterium]|nr:MAG: hypothetical protein CSA22_06370 [Deltaproteobacteria bacterium]
MDGVRRWVGCFFVLLVLMTLRAEASDNWVEGTGMAEGISPEAVRTARNRALRNAVENAVGVMVSSVSVLKNRQLLEDRIYTNVSGYIRTWEDVNVASADGQTEVTVRARVATTALEKDLRAIRVILDAKGNPKTMVVLSERQGGLGSVSDGFCGIVADFFFSRAFEIVDSDQIKAIREADKQRFAADPSKAAVMGARYGAELLITGTVTFDPGKAADAYGVPVYSTHTRIHLKAIQTDTGLVVARLSGQETGWGPTPGNAGSEAAETIWNAKKEAFVNEILEQWRSEVLNNLELTLIISNCTPRLRRDLLKRLRSVPGVLSLDERTYMNGISECNATVEGTVIDSLEDRIAAVVPELVLMARSGYRFDFEVDTQAGSHE